MLNLVALVLSEQTVVDEDAGQLLADRPVQQHCRNGAVHSAGHGAEHRLVAYFLAQSLYLLVDEARHDPIALAGADIKEKSFEYLLAVLRVHDLGMELNGVDFLFVVFHRGARAVARDGCHPIALGQSAYIVGMAHPADARILGDVPEQTAVLAAGHGYLAVFALRAARLNRAARHICYELSAVADAEHGDTRVEYLGRKVGRSGVVDAVRSACKYYSDIARRLYLLDGYAAVRFYLGIDIVLTHAARDELIVLTAEIEHKHFFMVVLHYITLFI